MNANQTIHVLIADDFDMMREVMQLLLEEAEDIEVVGEVIELEEALEAAVRLRPDVVILNDYLPPLDSAHATKRFRQLDVPIAILIISMQVEPEQIEHSFAHGANGFMRKDEIGDCLVEAVRRIHRGEQFLSPKAASAMGLGVDL